jgi:hypothetical protein
LLKKELFVSDGNSLLDFANSTKIKSETKFTLITLKKILK